MNGMLKRLGMRVQAALAAAEGRVPCSRAVRWAFGAALAALLCALLALYNVYAGPLFNLNDIGSWHNRLLFLLTAAAVQGLLLLGVTAAHRGSLARLALRQLILTAGYIIHLLAINQKTYAFMEGVLPLIRAMDEGGLAAIAGMETSLSSPALTLLYALTRGPVYVMYPVKLACVAAFCALCIVAMCAADRRGAGIRAEVLLTLCLILPQGFMSAACAAQIDGIAAALTAISLALCLSGRRGYAWVGTALYGLAAAISGAALYALPVYLLLVCRGRLKGVTLAASALALVAACVPAVLAGQPAVQALSSPLRAVFGVPEYAAGAPNLMNLFPRAAMEEMPEYFMLSKIPQIDPVTNFSPYYTRESFAMIMHGMALLGLAGAAMAWALCLRRRAMSTEARVLALSLASMIACPGATAGAWLVVSVAALAAILAQPRLRLPACLVLFAAAGAAAYPVTGEILLPMEAALGLCLLALFDLLGMFDGLREGAGQRNRGEAHE